MRRELERRGNCDDLSAEEKHEICEKELKKILVMTEGVPVIKIIDIVTRNGFNVRFETQ